MVLANILHRFYVVLLAVTLFLPTQAIAEKEKKTVLYINSYHNGYHWSDGLLKGLRKTLNSGRFKLDFHIEYMDTKKFSYDTISLQLYRLYKQKFAGKKFDIIIISDNDALNFITRYRTELFGEVPVVFCGVNDLQPETLEAGNITGVVETFDLLATINVAKRIHPDRNKMVVLSDDSTTGNAIRAQIEQILKGNNTGIDLTFWTRITLEEAQERLGKLQDNSFLFIAPYYQTIAGRFYTSEEMSRALSQNSSVPIYTAWEFMVGSGALGGRVLSGPYHGEIAGKMALDILSGKDANTIPIIKEAGGTYLFDYKAMEQLGISHTQLPPNSKIINEPKTDYSLPKELFWTIMVSFILLLLALLFLLTSMHERRRVELQILDQLAFQETLMDTIPQLVSWKDIDGKFLGANQAYLDFFGKEDSDLLTGKTTSEIIKDSSYSRWSTEVENKVLKDQQARRKLRRKVISGNGEESWLEVNKVALKGQGDRLIGVLSTAENITKEQNLEKQLLQSQKLEAIGTLAGGIAHDFNNILTSIINSTELAIDDVAEGSHTESDLKRVLKAARRGGQVVQQILSFSRPAREGFRPTDMLKVVQETVHLMEASTPSNVTVKTTIDENDDYFVYANPTQMHQVILNLMTNACHALREQGGTLRIKLYKHHEPKTSEQHVVLQVSDSGPGIPCDIMDKIFDPFFSTKSKGEGTGLGLAVVHSIVATHNGSIQVENREQGGAVFTIHLPEVEGTSTTVSNLSFDKPGNGSILLVEDDELQLASTPKLLEQMGFSVTAVSSPLAALQRIEAHTKDFDLLISDFDMPDMNGA
ncbi:hybrid sensor histidine kinase/response regulator, partial [candidate division KSB3 bacterium]